MFAMWQLRRFSTNSWGNDFDVSLGGKKEDMRSISTKTHARNCQDMHSVSSGAIVDQVSHLMASNFLIFFGGVPWREP